MAKVRVYELARELKMESKALIAKLKDLGIEVASHQSTLTDEDVAKAKGANKSADGSGGTSKRRIIVRRRKKAEPEPAPVEEIAEVQASPEDAEPEGQEKESLVAEAVSDNQEANSVAEVEEMALDEAASGETHEVDGQSETPAKRQSLGAIAARERAERAREQVSSDPAAKTGAQIVRKASPDEVKAQKKRATEVTQNTYRAGDSASPRTSQVPGEVVPPSADDAGHGVRRKGKKYGEGTEEQDRVRSAPSKKRASTSMRDLLGSVDDDLSVKDLEDPSFRKRRRTVYAPKSAQRKRDIKRRKDLKSTEITTPKASLRVVKIAGEGITVGDLAKQMGIKAADIIKKLMSDGVMATLNQTLDIDTATLVASEYSFEVKSVVVTVDDLIEKPDFDSLAPSNRPPIVTVMGHVDHGKTSILDAIKESEVAAGEAGGITQHIGAYSVHKGNKLITFLDTPGHEAFSAMRARGAKVTDIVVLVVAADDGVMPQTIEAISHARDAGVPVIVAINKIDKPGQNLDRVFSELSEHGIQSEEWGGETQFVKVSALEKIGIDSLLEAIVLQAEMLELSAYPQVKAEGVVVEGHLEKGLGPVATVVVTNGTLKKGEFVVAGSATGRVRVMTDSHGKRKHEAGPSFPVQLVGLDEVPQAGDQVNVVADDKLAKQIADIRLDLKRRAEAAKTSGASLEDLLNKVNAAEMLEVPLIIKGDTQGSIEAIAESLLKIKSDKVKVRIVHKAVGGVNESDLSLAQACGGFICGFNIRAARGLDEEADKLGISIQYFSVIYELIDAVKNVMAGKLPPLKTEVVQGHAEVRNAISVPKVGVVAGSAVLDGKITRNAHLRLIREEIVIFDGRVGSLRRFKDDVKEVQNGYECGISIDGYNDIRIGDVIEAYVVEESAASL